MARVRSPNYPALSLPDAIKLVAAVQAAEQHLAAPKEVVAKHIGYSTYHGKAGRVISALENYGLLEEVNGDKVKVSDLAMSILFPASAAEKQKAINEAAYKHPLFATFRDEWQGSRPSDQNLRVYLIRRKFGSDALDRVIEVYKETMDLVTSDSGGYSAPNPADISHQGQGNPPMQQTHNQQVDSVLPPPPPQGSPYKVTFTTGGIEVVARITDLASADEVINTINALKLLLKPASEIKRPDDGMKEAAN
jgi:hypothetical protein